MTTKTDEYVIMTLRGHLCEIMKRIDPKLYRKFITKDKKGNSVLYVQLHKSLYGLLRSALLFYKKFRKEFEDYGFVSLFFLYQRFMHEVDEVDQMGSTNPTTKIEKGIHMSLRAYCLDSCVHHAYSLFKVLLNQKKLLKKKMCRTMMTKMKTVFTGRIATVLLNPLCHQSHVFLTLSRLDIVFQTHRLRTGLLGVCAPFLNATTLDVYNTYNNMEFISLLSYQC